MHHGIFATEARDTESEMFDDGASSLSMDEIAVGEGIFKHRDDGVAVVR